MCSDSCFAKQDPNYTATEIVKGRDADEVEMIDVGGDVETIKETIGEELEAALGGMVPR